MFIRVHSWLILAALSVGFRAAAQSPGETLARQVCSSCHLFTEPNLVDKKNWREQILPRMETRLGVSPPDYSSSPEGELLRSLHLYPDEPALSKMDWQKIVDYYLAEAPETALPQDPHPEIKVGLSQFEVVPSRSRHNPPLTTLVRASKAPGIIYAGDDRSQSITILDAKGTRLDGFSLGNIPIDLHETEQGIYVAAIGSIPPSEYQRGELFYFEKKDGKFGARQTILTGLPRAAQIEFADLNGDGREDFVMCLFGNHRGRFSWFENKGAGQYEEHPLFEKSGAIHCAIHDFNGDGLPDIALLVAQETEAMLIFTNLGKGRFTMDPVFQRHPASGHNYFELADFNKDGKADLLVVNGDNGEYDSPAKKYHGVRIYLNRGGNRFEESWFFPINGASKAVARDFDGDGDLDIAVISFFPDYEKSPRESFVYLENRGNLKFEPSTFRECITGRWIVMDAADIDGDGDIDIVLGSYIRGPTSVPKFLADLWQKQSPSVLILRNKLK